MNFASIIKGIAPMLASSLLGPLAPFAVGAIQAVLPDEHKQAIDDARNKGGISAAISKIGELFANGSLQAAQLKQAELKHSEAMAELGYKHVEQIEQINAQDRQSARQMQIAVKSKIPAMLATLVTVGFFGILIGMMLGKLSVANNQALLILLGALATGWGAVMQFYFGSSEDSHNKTQTMSSLLQK